MLLPGIRLPGSVLLPGFRLSMCMLFSGIRLPWSLLPGVKLKFSNPFAGSKFEEFDSPRRSVLPGSRLAGRMLFLGSLSVEEHTPGD